MRLDHLGYSGLRLTWPGGATVAVDPPAQVEGPVVLTWSEPERTRGARLGAGHVAAHPALLAALGIRGVHLGSGTALLDGFALRAAAYRPIPYAVPAEAIRKARTALLRPRLAASRLWNTLRRPHDPPMVVELAHEGVRVLLLGQSLHRFADARQLAEQFVGADVAVAGTDFEDEEATGRLLAQFAARHNVLADLVGEVRRELGLPVRPLTASLGTAPPGTRALEPGQSLSLWAPSQYGRENVSSVHGVSRGVRPRGDVAAGGPTDTS